jgi:DNA-binding SARP family transcriptional activator
MAPRTGGDRPPRLEIRVLGELDLRLGQRRLPPLASSRATTLLAYLLVHRDAPQPRERIAFVLWPDSTEPQARTNLRDVLDTLRRALPDADRHVDVTQRMNRCAPTADSSHRPAAGPSR